MSCYAYKTPYTGFCRITICIIGNYSTKCINIGKFYWSTSCNSTNSIISSAFHLIAANDADVIGIFNRQSWFRILIKGGEPQRPQCHQQNLSYLYFYFYPKLKANRYFLL